MLANRSRLQIFRLIRAHPGQTVSDIARELKLPLPTASRSLRALEARTLLVARRSGRAVEYRLGGEGGASVAGGLVRALRTAIDRAPHSLAALPKLATAFTHPRRISIYRNLSRGPQRFREIRGATRISARALCRHLRKLRQRGFVCLEEDQGVRRYRTVKRQDPLGREFARLAATR